MKISKLLIERILKCNHNYSGHIDENRCMGTSTGFALKAISYAMLNPTLEVKISEIESNIIQNRSLVDKVSSIISKLELKYFTINSAKCTIVYEPFIVVK